MTEMVNSMYTSVVGTSSVPPTGVMGPVQGSAGLLGLGGGDALSGGSGANWKSLMATGTTFASAGMSVFSGQQQAGFLKAQGAAQAQSLLFSSEESLMDAKQATLQGQQKSTEIMDNLVQTLATQRLNFTANGVDPTFGTPTNVGNATSKIADMQLSTTRSDAQQLALSRRAQSASYLAQRDAALSAAAGGAGEVMTKAYSAATNTISDWNERRILRG